MARFQVLLTDYAWPDVEIERALLREAAAEIVVAEKHDEETLCGLAPQADAAARTALGSPMPSASSP